MLSFFVLWRCRCSCTRRSSFFNWVGSWCRCVTHGMRRSITSMSSSLSSHCIVIIESSMPYSHHRCIHIPRYVINPSDISHIEIVAKSVVTVTIVPSINMPIHTPYNTCTYHVGRWYNDRRSIDTPRHHRSDTSFGHVLHRHSIAHIDHYINTPIRYRELLQLLTYRCITHVLANIVDHRHTIIDGMYLISECMHLLIEILHLHIYSKHLCMTWLP